MYPKALIELAFSDDEYDDCVNDTEHMRCSILTDFFYRNFKPGEVIEVGCGSGSIMKQIPEIKYGIDPNSRRLNTLKALNIREPKYVRREFAENLHSLFVNCLDTILCWGSFCFFRSQWEALIAFNFALKVGGRLIFDIVTKSNLPISQTADGDSFCNSLEKCFGFKIIERREFGEEFAKRLAIAAEKVVEFNDAFLRIPFLKKDGSVGNFLYERDWYLK
jgi:SAM-dependent methyltransferase